MLKKIIIFLKKIFDYNTTLYLPEAGLEGNGKVYKFESDKKKINGTESRLDYINNYKGDFESKKEINTNQWEGIDLISYVFDEKDKEDVINETSKNDEMQRKINYYKNNLKLLDKLSSSEIWEMNSYYEQKIYSLKQKIQS